MGSVPYYLINTGFSTAKANSWIRFFFLVLANISLMVGLFFPDCYLVNLGIVWYKQDGKITQPVMISMLWKRLSLHVHEHINFQLWFVYMFKHLPSTQSVDFCSLAILWSLLYNINPPVKPSFIDKQNNKRIHLYNE